MGAKGLLLDRDGVVNIDHGYVVDPGRFDFVPGIFDLVRSAVDRGFRVAVVTNQSGIARGRYSEDAFHALTAWMQERFAAAGAPLGAVLYAPHHPEAVIDRYRRDSFWRKPAPGMILEAVRRLGLDPGRSVMLGDQPTDMTAARLAGVAHRLRLAPGTVADPDSTRVVASLEEAGLYLHNL